MLPSWSRSVLRTVRPNSSKRKPALRIVNLEDRTVPGGNPPTALPIPRQVVNEDASALSLNLSNFFTDPEGDPLTYSIVQTNTTGLVTPSIVGSNLTLAF